jgi:hypothetical protein
MCLTGERLPTAVHRLDGHGVDAYTDDLASFVGELDLEQKSDLGQGDHGVAHRWPQSATADG